MPSLRNPILVGIVVRVFFRRIQVSKPVCLRVQNQNVAARIVPVQNVSFGANGITEQVDLLTVVKVRLLNFEDGIGDLVAVVAIERFEPLHNLPNVLPRQRLNLGLVQTWNISAISRRYDAHRVSVTKEVMAAFV